MAQSSRKDIADAQQALKEATRRYRDHIEINPPKPRRFGSNRKFKNWEIRRKELERDKLRSASKVNKLASVTDEQLTFDARRIVKTQHPIEAGLVKQHQRKQDTGRVRQRTVKARESINREKGVGLE